MSKFHQVWCFFSEFQQFVRKRSTSPRFFSNFLRFRNEYFRKRKERCAGARFQTRSGPKNERTTHDGRSFRIRRPPLRFSAGAPGEKTRGLWDCGIVGLWDCGEIAISEISGFFMFFLIWKMAKISLFKGSPPLVWRRKSGFPEEAGECRPGKKLQELGN